MRGTMLNRLKDDYKHKGMRKQLIQELRLKGIQDEKVLQAMLSVPRHWFLDKAFEEKMYEDRPFSIDANQTISHPFTVAFQTQLLEINPGDKVLEIGTGSGYQACILAAMGAKVYTIERQEVLFKKTSLLLPKLGFNQIRTLFGDGYEGADRFAPFDKIIVTCGASEIPNKLLGQLIIDGRMVIPLGEGQEKSMVLLRRTGQKTFKREKFGSFKFVPFMRGTNKSN